MVTEGIRTIDSQEGRPPALNTLHCATIPSTKLTFFVSNVPSLTSLSINGFTLTRQLDCAMRDHCENFKWLWVKGVTNCYSQGRMCLTEWATVHAYKVLVVNLKNFPFWKKYQCQRYTFSLFGGAKAQQTVLVFVVWSDLNNGKPLSFSAVFAAQVLLDIHHMLQD